jgi:hypothetical protein
MRVFTSYFGKYRGKNGVSIAIGATWWLGRRIKEFAPTYSILDMKDNEEQYREAFLKHLEKFGELGLSKLQDGDVLLCFEKSDKFCHRHIVAEWLQKKGFEVTEL